MTETPKKKEILKKVVSALKSEKDGYCRITNKEGWFGFLADGDLVFTPGELHQVLKCIIKKYPPRGEKLFCLGKRKRFTPTSGKEPFIPEAALERFIVVSNPEKFYDQIPIGGGKESIDIGIRESDEKFIFVELKPWRSTNTPLYAIVESLKNLMEYRFILENGNENVPRFKEVDLIVLAPKPYWDDYKLNESSGLKKMKRALNDFSVVFNTNISLMQLLIEERVFFDKCGKIYDERGIDKQGKIRVLGTDAIPKLARDQWKLLVASDKVSTRN